jgi:SAM-dependent methyltransferase
MTITELTPPDLTQVKRRQQQMWASGDFHAIATRITPVADQLVDALDLVAGWRVLDVACGSGNATIAAARCGCAVTGVDYVPALIERGKRRAAAEGVAVDFVEGDAEALPFADGSFDAVVSVFGAMFAPDQRVAAAELVRVCRPGGRIGLATWTPDGFVGEMLKVVTAHVPPPPGVASPLLWGSKRHLSDLLNGGIAALSCTERTFTFRYPSADAFVDHFRAYYGPTLKAFETVGPAGAAALHADLVGLIERHSGTKSGPVAIPGTWLETVATRAD